MNKIISFFMVFLFLSNTVLAQGIDFRAIEDKLAGYDSEVSAVDVSTALFTGVDSAQLTKDLETLKTSEKLKAIATRLSSKIKKGNFVTLGEAELASQDGVQVAGPMFLNSTNVIAVLGWIFLFNRN